MQKILQKVLVIWKEILCVEVLMIGPQVFVGVGFYAGGIGVGYADMQGRVNFMANFGLSFVIIIALFGLVCMKQIKQ